MNPTGHRRASGKLQQAGLIQYRRAGYVADTNNSFVCFDAAPADCQPEPGSIFVALPEGQERSVRAARWQTNAEVPI